MPADRPRFISRDTNYRLVLLGIVSGEVGYSRTELVQAIAELNRAAEAYVHSRLE